MRKVFINEELAIIENLSKCDRNIGFYESLENNFL